MKKILFAFLILFTQCKTAEKEPVIPVPNLEQEDIEEIDVLIEDYMSKFSLPGVSLAIAKDGALVYQKGYGFADVESGEEVNVDHVFRIASCSKPYTGMAIMKLVENGAIELSDKVFGPGAILGTRFGSKAYSESLKQITVSQLLLNTSGAFVNSQKQDLINMHEELGNGDYLSWVLDNSIQEFAPGSSYHYVNVNFFVAAMIVEEFLGIPFYDYLQNEVLYKVFDDVTRPAVSNSKLFNEVKYYGQGNLKGREYDFSMERFVGSGNLVTNSRSMLRFAISLGGASGSQSLLPTPLMEQFVTTTPHNPNWGHGIGVLGERLYMYGSLPSTRSGWMLDKQTGLTVAIISNSNADYTSAALDQEIGFGQQDLLIDLVSKQRAFKDIDQFLTNVF